MSTALPVLLLFLTAVSMDSLTAGLTYGTQRVKLQPAACLILTFIPSLFITAANRVGSFLYFLLPQTALPFLSFTLLMLLGLSKLIAYQNELFQANKAKLGLKFAYPGNK